MCYLKRAKKSRKLKFTLMVAITAVALLLFVDLRAEDMRSLEECRTLARTHFAAYRQEDLLNKAAKAGELLLRKIITPNISAYAYAVYLSEVPDIGGILADAFDVTSAPNDRIKAGLFVTQSLYDGGEYKLKKKEIIVERDLQMQSLEEEMLRLDNMVDEIFFLAILAGRGAEQLRLQQETVELKIKDAESLASEGLLLKKDLLQADMTMIELETAIREIEVEEEKLCAMLSELIGESITDSKQLMIPYSYKKDEGFVDPAITQLTLLQEKNIIAGNLSQSATLPKLTLFGSAGYGKPGFNMFKNRFDWYGGVGMMLQIPITGWRDYTREKMIINFENDLLQEQKENLQKRRNMVVVENTKEVARLESLETQQRVALNKLKQIREQMELLLEEGEISMSEYLNTLNDESRAELKLEAYSIAKQREIVRGDHIIISESNSIR